MPREDDHTIPIIGTREGYDRWSEIYDQDANPLIAVEESVFERLVGDPTGLEIIDVGCGTGRHALRLAQRGGEVTAVDFSSGMLDCARGKDTAGRVCFLKHDVTRRLPFPDGSFDLVVCALVLDHIHPLQRFLAELQRLCRSDGRIILTVMHPAMMLKGVQARFIDPATSKRVALRSATHSISDYVNATVSCGMRIVAVEEHAVGEDVVGICPRAEKYLGWPIMFAMILGR